LTVKIFAVLFGMILLTSSMAFAQGQPSISIQVDEFVFSTSSKIHVTITDELPEFFKYEIFDHKGKNVFSNTKRLPEQTSTISIGHTGIGYDQFVGTYKIVVEMEIDGKTYQDSAYAIWSRDESFELRYEKEGISDVIVLPGLYSKDIEVFESAKKAYVVTSVYNKGVVVIDLDTKKVLKFVHLGDSNIEEISINELTNKAYVSLLNDGVIVVIDTIIDEIIDIIPANENQRDDLISGIDVATNSNKIYFANPSQVKFPLLTVPRII